jgi:hypothetical protein
MSDLRDALELPGDVGTAEANGGGAEAAGCW